MNKHAISTGLNLLKNYKLKYSLKLSIILVIGISTGAVTNFIHCNYCRVLGVMYYNPIKN